MFHDSLKYQLLIKLVFYYIILPFTLLVAPVLSRKKFITWYLIEFDSSEGVQPFSSFPIPGYQEGASCPVIREPQVCDREAAQ